MGGFRQWKDRHGLRVRMAKEEMLSKGGVIGALEKDVQKLVSVGRVWVVL